MPTRRQALAALAVPAFLATPASGGDLRASIVGVGGRGSGVLSKAVVSPGVELVAVCDIDPAARDRGATIGKDHKPELIADWHKIIGRKDIDAVIIATPVYLHAEMAVAALDAGLSVYLEKPMGRTEQEVKAVFEATKRAKGVFQTGFQLRYDPVRRAAIDFIHQGGIGEIAYMQGNRHGGDLPREKEWYFDAARSGNIIVEQAVHILDIMNWAMQTHPVRAMGSGGVNVYKDVPKGRTIYDNYAVIFEYPGDVRLCFTHVYFDPTGFTGISERIWGSEGAVDLSSGMFYTLTERGEERVPPKKLFEGDRGDMNQNAVDAFFKHVREKSEPLNNATYGKYATLMAIMGRKAIDEKRAVTWDEVDI